ncbi:M1 family metallopeptidase [Pedobacter gandavensis]|uniref:M1 family metallopeptidase n=1 Tax=Pedobacter gandavensis TaxID=2679963 RepID=UPI00292F0AB7|nr:M1 family metallopeptidase [Pedobacter gandavensis]
MQNQQNKWLKAIFPVAFSVLLSVTTTTSAQDLYLPRNIKMAYEKGTRSKDGKPGKQYWQNKGKYDMTISVDPNSKIVSGSETIKYTNHSPDTLQHIAIRFVNNLHKPNAPRANYVSKDFLSEGLTISDLQIDGQKYNAKSENWETVESLKLKKPLYPGQTAELNISWSYPLSKESGREGQLDNSTFFVAYAFPRVSVYDDYNGWDLIPHTDRTEFYNDFNDYKLMVRAPKNYVVWATGDFQNPDEVLNPVFAERLKKSYSTEAIAPIANAEEMAKGLVTQQKDWNSWVFTADHIPDMTFALSNHYLWDAGSVVVDSKTGRRASAQAAYDAKATDFPHAVDWTKQSLSWFSNNWPGVAYPYSKMTAVRGFADMEYPMMINDSTTPDLEFSQFVLNHEVAHTYFPFYMGTNETRYAHMDEGWATTFEYLISTAQLGKEKADENFKQFRVSRWINDPSTEEDQPIISLSTQVSGPGYSNNAYGKPALAYLALKDMLGDLQFKKYLHAYMERWNGKHPIPWDFFYTFNNVSGQNLNWYWNNWFFSNHYIDLSIKQVSNKGLAYQIQLQNIGGFAIPFDVRLKYKNGTIAVFHQSPAIWKDNQRSTIIKLNAKQAIAEILIDGGIFMDASPADNIWKDK